MKHITVKPNPLHVRVYINDTPSLDLIPKDVINMIVSELDKQIQAEVSAQKQKPPT